MKADSLRQTKPQYLKSKIADYARLVRFSHTVFALPFALSSIALAWPRHPVTLRGFLWILIAMVSARSAAMGFNRLVDRKFDALNPRTQAWELPTGKVKVWEASLLTTTASLLFVFAAYQLNWICLLLSPVALAIVFFYSLTKRFTWASHLFLGLALAIAPIGAWLAVAGQRSTLPSWPCRYYWASRCSSGSPASISSIHSKIAISTVNKASIRFRCDSALPPHCGCRVFFMS